MTADGTCPFCVPARSNGTRSPPPVNYRKGRFQYPRAKRDFYTEERWCTELLLDKIGPTLLWPGAEVWDPCCGIGNIVKVCRARGYAAFGTDIEPRGAGAVADFLTIAPTLASKSVANVFFNPPYGRGRWLEFVTQARRIAANAVAVFLPLASLASEKRYVWFTTGGQQMKHLIVLSSRPSPGPGDMISNGTLEPVGGMVDFGWFVWQRGHVGPPTILWAKVP